MVRSVPIAKRQSPQTQDAGRAALVDLLTSLRLSYDDASRLFGVSGETVRRWSVGASGIPLDTAAKLSLIGDSLAALRAMFEPERLPLVVRRNADLFDGETALAWILRGRIAEVASRYERVLRYQG